MSAASTLQLDLKPSLKLAGLLLVAHAVALAAVWVSFLAGPQRPVASRQASQPPFCFGGTRSPRARSDGARPQMAGALGRFGVARGLSAPSGVAALAPRCRIRKEPDPGQHGIGLQEAELIFGGRVSSCRVPGSAYALRYTGRRLWTT